MSEAAAISKVFYIFLVISLSSGFSLICFTDFRSAPVGKILQFKAKAFPHRWPLRTGLLVLLLLIVTLVFFAVFKEKHRLNIVLAVLVFLLLVVEISMAGKRLTWRNEQETVVNKQGDGNTMLQQYGVDLEITKIMDYVQSSYSCCGVTDYRDWASTAWALQVQKINAVPPSCCKVPGPGCGDELDIKDPFENIFVQGCTQLLYFNKSSDHIHGGVGMAVLFLHWCAILGCILLSCAVTKASGVTPIQALQGEQPDEQSGEKHGTKSLSGDMLDYEEENQPPKGARNMLTDKSEIESRPTECEQSDTIGRRLTPEKLSPL